MSAFDTLIQRARQAPARVALPEACDERVLEAAVMAAKDGRAVPVLVGEKDKILEASSAFDLQGIEIVDTQASAERETLADALHSRRKHKGMTEADAFTALQDPLTYACTLVHTGQVDGCVAGAEYPTADVTRTAMQIVGTASDASFVSSFFLMVMQHDFQPLNGIAVFADCALMVDPDAEQLAEIALQTGSSTEALLGAEPSIAMLSFSTAGSANHPHVSKVADASKITEAACNTDERKRWKVMGDVQLDAAVIPEILQKKAPHFASRLGIAESGSGPDANSETSPEQDPNLPNVFIFPTLDAGNIGYKLVERFGGCDAVGPVLQGLARPVNDLSRGCKASDIEKILAITSLQARSTLQAKSN